LGILRNILARTTFHEITNTYYGTILRIIGIILVITGLALQHSFLNPYPPVYKDLKFI